MTSKLRKAAGLAGAAATLSLGALAMAPANAQSSSMAMLKNLEAGQWQIRFRDSQPARNVCVRTGQELIQLRHRGASCSRYVVEDGANQVTVQYSCKGNGYGRTNIRRETNSLVQIESQGFAGDKPFQFTAEARRTGACR